MSTNKTRNIIIVVAVLGILGIILYFWYKNRSQQSARTQFEQNRDELNNLQTKAQKDLDDQAKALKQKYDEYQAAYKTTANKQYADAMKKIEQDLQSKQAQLDEANKAYITKLDQCKEQNTEYDNIIKKLAQTIEEQRTQLNVKPDERLINCDDK